MGGNGHLRAGDADAVVRLIELAYEDEPGLSLPAAAFDGLRELIPGAHVQYQVNDVVRRRWIWTNGQDPGGTAVLEGTAEPEELELEARFFELVWQDRMWSRPLRTGDRRTVMLSTDFFPSRRDMLNRPFIQECSPGATTVLAICLPSQDGCERRVVLGRQGGPTFDERDRRIAELLRPHLQEIWVDAQRRRAGVPHLTPREWEVLALTASGLTHPQIASRLFISTSTVHKHLEHVRERLGVRTTVQAAAAALPFAPTRQSDPPRKP